MKIGKIISNWMRTGIKPSDAEVREVELQLDKLQGQNINNLNWPSVQREANFKDVQTAISNAVIVAGAGDVVGPAGAATNHFPYFDGATGKLIKDSGYAASDFFPDHREVLTGGRDYYVRKDGNDSNTGLADTAGGAFLTIQYAVNLVVATLDFANTSVTIFVRDGTYAETIEVEGFLHGRLFIKGNTTTPTNVIISGVYASGNSTEIHICGFGIVSSDFGIMAEYGATIYIFDNMDYGACTGSHIKAYNGGSITVSGSYSISGNSDYHYSVDLSGKIIVENLVVTVATGLTFVDFVRVDTLGLFYSAATYTLVGVTPLGRIGWVSHNSVICSDNTLPGTDAAVAVNGGIFDA
jgi:hypothetical protein